MCRCPPEDDVAVGTTERERVVHEIIQPSALGRSDAVVPYGEALTQPYELVADARQIGGQCR
jgi:hypothetical protein